MLTPRTSSASPNEQEIDHLVDGIPHWYPAGHPTHGHWQIPILPAPTIDSLPTSSRAYDKRQRSSAETILHGYLADRKLRTHARNPGRWVTRFQPYWGVISPDFSIWLDQPPDRKLFAVRMSRAVGVFYALRGIRVIPTLRWGDRRDYDFVFLGVESHSAVAISNYGLWLDPGLRQNFVNGLPEMVERIAPDIVFLHGTTDHPAIRDLARKTEVVPLIPDRTRIRMERG